MLINCSYIQKTVRQILPTSHSNHLPSVEVQQFRRDISVSVHDIHKNNVVIDAAFLPQ